MKKLSVQDLADLVSEKQDMNKKHVDAFIRSFFQLIEEELGKSGYVKIKGLGTFKLINIESRESININTGERFEIQEHSRITFTPDPVLKDTINKPFAHFETVILNEGTVFDDMPVDIDNEIESPSSLEEKEEPSEEVKKDVEQIPENFNSHVKKEYHRNFCGLITAIISILIVVLLGIGLFIYKVLSKERDDQQLENTMIIGDSLKKIPQEVSLEEIRKIDTTNTKEQEKQIVKTGNSDIERVPFEPDSTNYVIIGTKTTYTIQEGETLVKVALRFYGTKVLWPYLVKYNSDIIKHPDNVHPGTTINIPELKKK